MSKLKRDRTFFGYKFFIHIFFWFTTIFAVLPFLLLISISFTYEDDIIKNGYALIPERLTTDAYRFVLKNSTALVDAYGITALYAIIGTFLSVVVMAMIGYSLSRDKFILKKPLTIFLLITMFFNGGLIPTYLINTQFLHLGNNLLMYVLYGWVTAYTVFVFKSFFKQIPTSLIEAAEIDGATESTILTKIMIPLSLPVLATFGFTGMVTRWNDYTTSMYYMTDSKLYTLQYMLQNVLNEAEFLKSLQQQMPGMFDSAAIPAETMKFAMCILAAGPMIIIFPFFQKYFSKGMVVGAVKG